LTERDRVEDGAGFCGSIGEGATAIRGAVAPCGACRIPEIHRLLSGITEACPCTRRPLDSVKMLHAGPECNDRPPRWSRFPSPTNTPWNEPMVWWSLAKQGCGHVEHHHQPDLWAVVRTLFVRGFQRRGSGSPEICLIEAQVSSCVKI